MRLFAIYFAFVAALAAAFTQTRTTTIGEILGILLLGLSLVGVVWFVRRCIASEDSGVEHDPTSRS